MVAPLGMDGTHIRKLPTAHVCLRLLACLRVDFGPRQSSVEDQIIFGFFIVFGQPLSGGKRSGREGGGGGAGWHTVSGKPMGPL